jgi:hypothetical protein
MDNTTATAKAKEETTGAVAGVTVKEVTDQDRWQLGQRYFNWQQHVNGQDIPEKVILAPWFKKGVPSGAMRVSIAENDKGILVIECIETQGECKHTVRQKWLAVKGKISDEKLAARFEMAGIPLLPLSVYKAKTENPGQALYDWQKSPKVAGEGIYITHWADKAVPDGAVKIVREESGNGLQMLKVVEARGDNPVYFEGDSWLAVRGEAPKELEQRLRADGLLESFTQIATRLGGVYVYTSGVDLVLCREMSGKKNPVVRVRLVVGKSKTYHFGTTWVAKATAIPEEIRSKVVEAGLLD